MQPLGRKPIRFPGKIDYHLPKGYSNWWKKEINIKSGKNKENDWIIKGVKGEFYACDDEIFKMTYEEIQE